MKSPDSLHSNSILRIRSSRDIYFLSLLVGALAALGAAAFASSLAWGEHFTYDWILGLARTRVRGEIHAGGEPMVPSRLWLFPLVTGSGGLLVGLFTYFVSPEAAGTGTDGMIDAFHNREGRMGLRMALAKTAATILTLMTGGSAGKEGPIAQIGSGIGSFISDRMGGGARARRTLLLAGTAGGLGAIFRAPFGGALTAVEVIYREDLESDSLVPALISSITAYMVYTALLGHGTLFNAPELSWGDYRQLPFFVLLGLACTAGGYGYIHLFHGTDRFFHRLPVHPILRPAIGGFLVGSIGFFYPSVIGPGMGAVEEILNGELPWNGNPSNPHPGILAFLLFAFLKMLTTSLTVGSGGSGGVFAPSLFIGGMIGGFVGQMASLLAPGLDVSIPAFVLVGMASFFAGVANAPVASMIMVSDMAGTYHLLPALMIVSMIAVTMSSRWSIYRGQVRNRFLSPAHNWDMKLDLLDRIPLGSEGVELSRTALVDPEISLADLKKAMELTRETDFIAVDDSGFYRGTLSLRNLPAGGKKEESMHRSDTGELLNSLNPVLTLRDSLGDAVRSITTSGFDKVAVLDQGKVVGHIGYSDIFHYYIRRAGSANISGELHEA